MLGPEWYEKRRSDWINGARELRGRGLLPPPRRSMEDVRQMMERQHAKPSWIARWISMEGSK